MKHIAFGTIVLLWLTVAKGLFPQFFAYLPLGGSAIAELGIVLGIAVSFAVIDEIRKSKNE